ncbi:MAG: hypothetical protein ACRDJK_03260, partial [Actinomycetota bacterium]
LAIWKSIASSGHDSATVLEDDVVLGSGFVDAVRRVLDEAQALDPGWDLVYLGRRHWGPDEEIGSALLVRPGYSACLHGYVLRSTGANKLIEADILGRMMPVDEFVPACISRHPRPDITKELRPVLSAFACRSDLATQLPRNEWGSETEATEFVIADPQ